MSDAVFLEGARNRIRESSESHSLGPNRIFGGDATASFPPLGDTPSADETWAPILRSCGQDHWLVPALAIHATQSTFGGYFAILHQIGELSRGDAEDLVGVLRPTQYAIGRSLEILEKALQLMLFADAGELGLSRFPRGSVTTDENGGIRIEWNEPARAVRLVVGASYERKSYIYVEIDGKYRVVTPDGYSLAFSLVQLLG